MGMTPDMLGGGPGGGPGGAPPGGPGGGMPPVDPALALKMLMRKGGKRGPKGKRHGRKKAK